MRANVGGVVLACALVMGAYVAYAGIVSSGLWAQAYRDGQQNVAGWGLASALASLVLTPAP